MRRSRAAQARAPLNRPLAPSADMPTADRELLSCGFLRPICADLHQQPTRLATTGAFAPQIQGSAPCSKAFPQILDGEILTVRGFLACVSQDPVCDFFFFLVRRTRVGGGNGIWACLPLPADPVGRRSGAFHRLHTTCTTFDGVFNLYMLRVYWSSTQHEISTLRLRVLLEGMLFSNVFIFDVGLAVFQHLVVTGNPSLISPSTAQVSTNHAFY